MTEPKAPQSIDQCDEASCRARFDAAHKEAMDSIRSLHEILPPGPEKFRAGTLIFMLDTARM